MDTILTRLRFAELAGWIGHDHGVSLETFRRSCREMLEQGAGFSRPVRFGGSPSSWRSNCLAAFDTRDAKSFFESRFRAYRVNDPDRPAGLFTGYYEPEVDGSRVQSDVFSIPIYRRPPDLSKFTEQEQARSGLAYGRIVDGEPRPYLTRHQIEEGALAGRGLEIVWLREWADAFFIHVQGSGRVRLAEGGTLRLSYSTKSGHPYTGIGGLLVERGVIDRETMSMGAIRAWMEANPAEARALMWENKSFVFFREVELERPDLGAFGAQHVQLTPRCSLAVDRTLWMFGTPVWLDTTAPSGSGAGTIPFRQLLIAQDTGSAIMGAARGDIYWGFGEEAAHIAGPMKSTGQMAVLLPIEVSDELGLPS